MVPERLSIGGDAGAHTGMCVWRIALLPAVLVLAALLLWPRQALASGPDAVLTPVGYDSNRVARGDDTSILVVDLPFALTWNGTSYTQIYVNMNGNCTFGAGYTGYNPSTTLAALNRNIMAPLWSDVDTRNTATGQVTYSSTTIGSIPQVNGRNAFLVNWIGVASYNNQSAPLNSFQLVLVDRSDTGAGNFDFMFNYDQVTWDIATAASTYRARAGWGRTGAGFELPGSGVTQGSVSTLLDSSPSATSLTQSSMNSDGQLGRYVWQVRNGAPPNIPPQVSVVHRVLEGNAPDSYTGYTGTGDATATDSDGTVVSFTNDRPAVLPLGVTDVTWTATDDGGAMMVAHQYITVADTAPPTNPSLASPSHTAGVWSMAGTVRVDSPGDATDVCTGVTGFSYGWSQHAPSPPDNVPDAHTVTPVTSTATTTVDSQTFPNATWPAEWTRSSTNFVRLTNAVGRNHGTYAAEIRANNANRRTVDFYRDYDLTAFTSASLSFWNQVSALSTGADYARVEYSTDGGTSWTQLHSETGTSAAQPWRQHDCALPVGGTVRVRFSGSVNATSEYSDWDDITVLGFTTTMTDVMTTSTTEHLADGVWHYNLHTVDAAGNWSAATSLGPFLIDTVPPVTTDDAPAGWSSSPVSVTLTATDAGLVTYTEYALNGDPWVTYSGTIVVAAEGTTTLTYRSADAAGHLEVVRSVPVRVDTQAPTVPGAVTARAASTSTIELTWGVSTDATSGLRHYLIYRDGALVGTSTATTFEDVGLIPGEAYSYEIAAVDFADNVSVGTMPVSEIVPDNAIWMSVTPLSVDMGRTDPGSTTSIANAVEVTVAGIGTISYELLCNAAEFANIDTGASTGSLPASSLAYAVHGQVALPSQPFSTAPTMVDASVGMDYRWSRDYLFDLRFEVPWNVDAGTYTTTVTYTAIAN
jgi:hypothetical protein